MDSTLGIASPPAVRAAIARVMLGSPIPEPALGSIHLKPHQASSIERLMSALREFGGALLCDQVGMGKTFVALAVARRFERRLVVAPAALESMWRDALARADVNADFITYERLSRSDPPDRKPDLLILDEAHHARNPGTRRFGRIARLARDARVLLLTATPVHNRRADLVALLSFFLGSRANDLSERELSRCVVRRDCETVSVAGIPQVVPVVAYDVPDDPDIVARLMGLPPPLPARDAGSGGALINRGLVHQWASSEAALRDAVRRRVAKAAALIASLRAGRYPSAAELQAWSFADGALQLGFAELLSPPTSDGTALLESVLSHANALELFLEGYADASLIDEARARYLVQIRGENPGAKIVAFAQYSSTISTLFRRLVSYGRVAMLTANGARVAGGKLSRHDAIARFAPRANRGQDPPRAEIIDVLLATDLLSEGVNLQDAEVVVHLDVPWTAARMEQRVGRVARMGSSHSRVRVYQLRPPASAESVIHVETLVSSKWHVARRAVGMNRLAPFPNSDNVDNSPSSIPARAEQLRSILERWAIDESGKRLPEGRVYMAAILARETGFIAAGHVGPWPLLLTSRGEVLSTDLDAQIGACLLAEGTEAVVAAVDYHAARRAIQEWAERSEAAESAGAAVTAPARRKRLLNRIDAALQNAPPHLRVSRARVVAAARRVASTPHGAAVEQELEVLADSPLPDNEWLKALATLDALPKSAEHTGSATFRLRALLLFTLEQGLDLRTRPLAEHTQLFERRTRVRP